MQSAKWRMEHNNIKMQIAAEESKTAEALKFQEALETLKGELEAMKQEIVDEKSKSSSLKAQLETLHQEELQKNLSEMEETKKENFLLKAWSKFLSIFLGLLPFLTLYTK